MKLKISAIEQVTHDTFIYRLALPDPEVELGLYCGGHVRFHAKIPTKKHPEGQDIMRKYTPTSRLHAKGEIELPIKIY